MKKTQKKGFTLVELLVVIAILAILATVSVVGYTTFIDKANESNAITELTQIRDVVNASVIDGEEKVTVDAGTPYTVEFTYSKGTLTAKVGEAAASAEQIEAAIIKLSEMTNIADKVTVMVGTVDAEKKATPVTSIEYTYSTGVVAVWTIENNTVAIKEN